MNKESDVPSLQPWTVTYRHDSDEPVKTTIRANNGQISVSKPGRYELVSVTDAHCPGTVLDASKAYEIEWITKPTLHLEPNSGKLVKNGSLVRPAICEGIDDTAGVVFSGSSLILGIAELGCMLIASPVACQVNRHSS